MLSSAAAKLTRAADGNAEFMLAQASGDIRMRLRRYIRIHAQGDIRGLAQLRGASSQKLKLAFTFHVEKKNAVAQRQLQFIGGFTNAGKDDFFERFLLCAPYALQFSAGDNIKARAHPGQQPENAQVGVRFDRVAKRMPHVVE